MATQTSILLALAPNTTYGARVLAKNPEGASNWSSWGSVTTQPTPLDAPTGLDVEVLLGRQVEVSWDIVENATSYVVQMRNPQESNSAWVDHSPNQFRWCKTDGPSHYGPEWCKHKIGIHQHRSNIEVRVKATGDGVSYGDSVYSDVVTIVDNPTQANGHSPGRSTGRSTGRTGEADIKWAPISGVSSYTIRYRRLDGGDHSALEWEPEYSEIDTREILITNHPLPMPTQYTIARLQLGSIYAIQFNYTVSGRKFFSGRNTYVWPSVQAPQSGDRVATFPLNHPLTDNTYEYRICENTFPVGQRTRWSNLIKHAFEQWELATALEGGSEPLITMTYIDGPCADYTPFIDIIAREVAQYFVNPGLREVRDIVEGLLTEFRDRRVISPTLPDVQNRDEALNEVLMFDDVAGIENVLLEVGAFPEFSEDLGYPECAYLPNALGCAQRTPFGSGHTTDIFIKRSTIGNDPLVVPGGDITPSKDDIVFSNCPEGYYQGAGTSRRRTTSAYEILIHEAGHASGIQSGRQGTGQDAHHPNLERSIPSVMNYNRKVGVDEPDCSPHPFDVMAIHALYQSVP